MKMNDEMKSVMEQELAEAMAMLEKANTAFERLFGKQEREGYKCEDCVGNDQHCLTCDELMADCNCKGESDE